MQEVPEDYIADMAFDTRTVQRFEKHSRLFTPGR
ncbi:unnamed protein product [Ectocarpus sp. CCAP 1310/34]|nr:unnamed protein product [Ectocarpus sp. CCAP 1310/34]